MVRIQPTIFYMLGFVTKIRVFVIHSCGAMFPRNGIKRIKGLVSFWSAAVKANHPLVLQAIFFGHGYGATHMVAGTHHHSPEVAHLSAKINTRITTLFSNIFHKKYRLVLSGSINYIKHSCVFILIKPCVHLRFKNQEGILILFKLVVN